MTMKHKIEKYRIKGLASKLAQRGNQEDSEQTHQSQKSLNNVAKGSGAATAQAAQNTINQDLEAVRQEGLNARQLRMPRRTAQNHGLPFETDHEAVLKLRMQGIDPFERRMFWISKQRPIYLRRMEKNNYRRKLPCQKFQRF